MQFQTIPAPEGLQHLIKTCWFVHDAKEDFVARLAAQKIHEKQGNISLSELQRSLRLSERSLQRRFRQSVGLPPKLYLRIRRFQTSLAQIQRQDFDRLTDIAYDNGYADQSHFLRDFKEFTGCSSIFHPRPSPSAWISLH
ncbi:MAG: AraC family transcriptional regulator [Haliscomenobacteraceae bacterium CHB4]|nr:AraC family transcriptional regulator [Haliscomenobacteraceae bacterium CHB4]